MEGWTSVCLFVFEEVKAAENTGLAAAEKTSSVAEPVYLVKPIYESANSFSDGMALVLRDNKYFYIDEIGKEVISLPYKANDIIHGDFHEGVELII